MGLFPSLLIQRQIH